MHFLSALKRSHSYTKVTVVHFVSRSLLQMLG